MRFGVSAPGKVILHGEHAVVYGKGAVAVSIDLRTEIRVEPCADVVLLLTNLKHEFRWPLQKFDQLSDMSLVDSEIAQPTEQVLKKLHEAFDITPQSKCYGSIITFLFLYISISRKAKQESVGAKIVVSSALPIGGGLGSSAAYSVALAAAILRLYGAVKSTHGVPSEEDLSLINKWSFQSETILHGKPSGIDNSVCTFGGALLFRLGKIQELTSRIPLYNILLVNTKVPRDTKQLVASVRSRAERQRKIFCAVLDAVDEVSSQCWLNLRDSNLTNEQQYQAAAELIAINHHLMNAIGAGHPQLDKMVSLASAAGFSSKLTGAGGGGCGFVLIEIIESADESKSTNERVASLKTQLEENGMQCWQVAMGCPGIMYSA
ncbi:mevalonate kinase [Galendromus occidentalis]|uniref:Mevalonate kinase n=1 Tax=Galendromus occidentalis TaxID=34638 RepID=A0AAJ7L6Q4_9ACAR|nr:mevalonate kinase [Galendromus occidentalis]